MSLEKERAISKAWDDYCKKRAKLIDEYKKAIAPHRRAYKNKTEPITLKHHKKMNHAKREYNKEVSKIRGVDDE